MKPFGFGWSDALEAPVCIHLNRVNASSMVRRYFVAVSQLGNGLIWYTLLAALPIILGVKAIPLALHICATACVGVLIYKTCKRLLVRDRPFVANAEIRCYGRPMDTGSFPSGHTIHAVSFTIILGTLFPIALWGLVPLAVSIALSRVVLGHHYPSDVLAGAVIGAGLAKTSLSLLPMTLQ